MESSRTYTMGARAKAVEATRARIAETALEHFLAQPYDDVTIAGVAKAAGVSHQTVINHFESKERLFLAATAVFAENVDTHQSQAVTGDVASIVSTIVDRYEETGDANVRLSLLEDRIPEVAQAITKARADQRAWLEEVFGPLLPEEEHARRLAVMAAYAATDVFVWKLLRRDHGLGREDTERVMRDTAEALVASWTGGDR
jgi:AcrR family transcriptional regulator